MRRTRGQLLFSPRAISLYGFCMLSSFALAQTSNMDAENFSSAFRKLKRNDSLQFDFTTAEPPAETPQWLKNLFENGFFKALGGFFQFLGHTLTILFWVGVGMALMGFLYLIATTLMAARFNRSETLEADKPVPLYQPEQSQARILLAEIDALAAQGKYAEAVHTLLFRSIQDIDANRPNIIRRSLTSREIGELDILTAESRSVFSNIASIVERSFFGGQEIGQADFDVARAAYAELASQSGQWAANDPHKNEQAA